MMVNISGLIWLIKHFILYKKVQLEIKPHKVMQIRIKETKTYCYPSTMVAEGKLVLVECEPRHAFYWISGKIYPFTFNDQSLNPLTGKYYKPIIISETEKIENGDLILYKHPRQDNVLPSIYRVKDANYSTEPSHAVYFNTGYGIKEGCKKIVVLPEQFSPQQLQDIVDGKLKDGDKVLVECEEIEMDIHQIPSTAMNVRDSYQIKLNSQGHVILHTAEEKTYKESEIPFKQIGEVLKYLEDQCVYDKMAKWNDPYYKLKKWYNSVK